MSSSWQLEAEAPAGRGVTGDDLSAPDGQPLFARSVGSDPEAEEFIRLERLGGPWPIPDDLQAALRGIGDALVAGDAPAVGRWLAPGVALGPGVGPAVARARPSASRVVACARIGEHRVVKLRVGGATASVALATRWRATGCARPAAP